MGRNRFQNYGLRAQQPVSFTEMSGRYQGQAPAERRILLDIIEKLDISPDDRLFDIGCGTGLLLLPLSFIVEHAVGLDHPDVVEVVRGRARSDTLELIGGNFLDADVEGRSFSKILVYGVVQYLETETELHDFVGKALRLLAPGGRMLIGDMPNIDKKTRFLESESGAAFEKEWKQSGLAETRVDPARLLPGDAIVDFTDEVVARLLLFVRSAGLDAYVVPQPPDLPFGRTREDLLVIAPR